MAKIPKRKEARELDSSVKKIKKWFLKRTRDSYCKKKVFRKERKPFKPTYKRELKKINSIRKKDSEKDSEIETNAYCPTTDYSQDFHVFVAKNISYDVIIGIYIITKSPKIYNKSMPLMRPEVNKLDVDIELDKILYENVVVFSKNDNDISETNFFKYKIVIKDHPPIRKKKRPASLTLQKLVKKKLDEMLKNKIIQPLTSPWRFDISAEGAKINKVKQAKILNFEVPTNHATLQSYLGFINYFRNFISNCAALLSELYLCLNIKTKFDFNSKCLVAFNKIKEILLKRDALVQPDIEGAIDRYNLFSIFIDASYSGIGACFMQRYEKHLRSIMFFSRALQGFEKNYHISDLEDLSLVSAQKKCKNIKYHTKVKIYTDHAPLVSFFTKSNLANRLLC
uniref:Retrotransposon-like protein 1 (inferred by orthology to a human protein) n=1 Tax=Strongyloides venezuelensis TaxID=75913 RepID=A0A0K0FEE8_STRVS